MGQQQRKYADDETERDEGEPGDEHDNQLWFWVVGLLLVVHTVNVVRECHGRA